MEEGGGGGEELGGGGRGWEGVGVEGGEWAWTKSAQC